ncbi:alpha/beta fold hydrolase [Streptomyces sp. NPDC052042]|uniref:alpha/beta fold hydrolase n=1 Tax=Streptomyces sp. NPDC052042 TaxID=3365683 RepID=UPI0037D2C49B
MALHVIDPFRIGTEQLPGGRLLGWAEWGPEDGVPVLLSPGAATSRYLGFGADVLDGLGVRLISVDRPGLGASSPLPGRTFGDFADDLRAFAGLRGLGRPLMVGNSQGAPFALACAAAGTVGALAVVSGADEVAEPRFADTLPDDLRGLVELAVFDPDAAEKIFGGFTARAMWDLVMSGSPACDLAVYRQPEFATAYRRALDEAFAQGATAGYARDTVLAMGRWDIELTAIAVPVDLWYGEKDTGHSPDHGEGLAARIPGAVRHLVPEAGGSLLWTHAEQVLTTLLGHAPVS